MNEKITLSGVPETMLQTVYARARESAGRGAIRDERTEELIARLDYDFSLAEKDTAMRSGVIARTIVLDRLVGAWLAAHPGAVSQLAMSAMDDWGGCITERDAPVLVVIEGLTMYLSEAEVKRIFAVIAGRFDKATVFCETMNPTVAKRFQEKSIEGSHAKFTWGVRDGKTLAGLLPGFRFAEEHCLTEGMAAFVPVYRLLDKLPFVRNISNRIVVLERE